jgi:hypothetical protein
VKVTHAHCAEVVFQDWRLPEAIVVAIRHHEAPARAPVPLRELASLVHLGMLLAFEAGFVHPLEPRPGHVARELLVRSLGLQEEALAPIVEGLPERVRVMLDAAG